MIITPSTPALRRPVWLRCASVTAIIAGLCICLVACSGTAPVTTAPVSPAQTSSASRTPPSGVSGTTSGSACALVTVDEVAAATGQPMKRGAAAVGVAAGVASTCLFSAEADPSIRVVVQAYGTAEGMAVPKALETRGQHLSGLGDDAFWASRAATIFIQKGDRGFTVSDTALLGSNGDAPQQIVSLATAALARL